MKRIFDEINDEKLEYDEILESINVVNVALIEIEHKNLMRDGEFQLKELERKRRKEKKKKDVMIKYIISHDKVNYSNDSEDYSYLMEYSYESIREMYNELKFKNLGFWGKIKYELFNYRKYE